MSKQYLFFLIDKDGRSYFVKNGIVQSSSQPKLLKPAPIGWDNISILWERNLSDIGVIKTFSFPLHFTEDGRKILLTRFFQSNVDDPIYLLIKDLNLQLTDTTYHFLYKYLYKGAVDLSTLQDDGYLTTVNLMQAGIFQKYNANKATVYEIDIESNHPQTVKLDGIDIEYTSNLTTLKETYSTTSVIPTRSQTKRFVISLSEQQDELGVRPYVSFYPVYKKELTTLKDDFFISSTGNVTISITFSLSGSVTRSTSAIPPTGNVKILLQKKDGTIIDTLLDQPAIGNLPFTINKTVSVNLVKDDELYLIAEVNQNSGVGTLALNLVESNIKISFVSRFKETTAPALKLSTVLKAITKKITGNELNCDTSYLEQHDNLVLTSGDAIRGIKGAKLKTSFDQFYQFCRAVLAAGRGIENEKILIAPYSHFYNNTVTPIDLGEVKEFSWSYANDLIGNTIKIGYPDKEIARTAGKFEFNNTHTYSLPITKVIKEINFVSPYLAQPYLIENRRIEFTGKATTDNQQDNDIFILNTDGNGNLKRATYDKITGIPDVAKDSIYNIEELTPKRLLQLQMSYINSIAWGLAPQPVKYNTTEKANELYTEKGNAYVDEDGNENIGSTMLFKPIYFVITAVPPFNLHELLESNPNPVFSFIYNDNNYKGFLVKAGYQPTTEEPQEFKLLCTPDTDLSKLIS